MIKTSQNSANLNAINSCKAMKNRNKGKTISFLNTTSAHDDELHKMINERQGLSDSEEEKKSSGQQKNRIIREYDSSSNDSIKERNRRLQGNGGK